MTIHWNSISSYSAVLPSIGHRHQEILDTLGDISMTDREIAEALGYSDLNAVRPRITELVQGDVLEENGTTTCLTTGRSVRLVRKAFVGRDLTATEYPEQSEMPPEEEPAETNIPDTFTSPCGNRMSVKDSPLSLGVLFLGEDFTFYLTKKDVDGLIDRLLQLTEEDFEE